MFFRFSLDYFVPLLFAFVVSYLLSSVLCQEIGWEERLRSDLFCVEWDLNTPFTRYSRLSNTGYQTPGCTTGLTTVLNEQRLFVQPVFKPGCTTGLTTG